jgi:KDO2-lipid IV(A) lauroyltransferase
MRNILHLFITGVFIFFLIMIGLLPFFVLYVFSDVVYLLLFNLIGYRKKVILKNLHDTFPDKTEGEIQIMLRKTYRNLVDVIVEGIKAFAITRKQVLKRHKLINPEVAETYLKQGRSIIIVTGHYANWEWGSLSASVFRNRQVIIFYKALSNPWIDRFMRWNRGRYGAKLASVKETTVTFNRYGRNPAIFLMAADQNPHNLKDCYWINFLGRDTVFLYGPEKHARRIQCPVLFAEVQRVRRGFYSVALSLLAENVKLMPDGELTLRYARKLESVILNKPEDWLWSHRRWKHKRPSAISHSQTPL